MDAVVRQMRDAIVDNDLKILAAINARLTLAARLDAYARQNGRDGLTAERERWMLRYLQGANRGPLSDEGLERLYANLVEITRSHTEAPPPS
jgi:chorismate mutase